MQSSSKDENSNRTKKRATAVQRAGNFLFNCANNWYWSLIYLMSEINNSLKSNLALGLGFQIWIPYLGGTGTIQKFFKILLSIFKEKPWFSGLLDFACMSKESLVGYENIFSEFATFFRLSQNLLYTSSPAHTTATLSVLCWGEFYSRGEFDSLWPMALWAFDSLYYVWLFQVWKELRTVVHESNTILVFQNSTFWMNQIQLSSNIFSCRKF